MEPVSTRLSDDTHRNVCERADANGESNSAVVRRLVEYGIEYGESDDTDERIAAVRAEYEAQISDLETDLERARRARRAANERAEDIGELARTREREQSLAERRAQAGVLTRARWWLTGMGEE